MKLNESFFAMPVFKDLNFVLSLLGKYQKSKWVQVLPPQKWLFVKWHSLV